MKLHKELLPWTLLFILACTGFFLLLAFTSLPTDEGERGASYLFFAAPAFFATLSLASFFLLIRTLLQRPQNRYRTRFRHLFAACIVSLAAVIAWEFSQLFLTDRTFAFSSIIGALVACLLLILFWLLFNTRMHQNGNKTTYS